MLVVACIALLVALDPYGGLTQATDLPLLCFGVSGLCAALLLPDKASFDVLAQWRLSLALGGVAVWALVCAVVSGRSSSATFGTDGTALGWPVVVLGTIIVLASAFHARRLRELLVWAAVSVLVVEFAATVFELLTGSLAVGTLSNSSFTGEVVVLLAPVVFWSGLQARGIWPRVWRFAVAATALWTVVVGGARVSMVALVAALLGWGVYWATRRYGRRMGIALGSALGVGALAGGVFVALRWSSLSSGALGDFWRSRWGLWEPAVRAIASRPIFGFGPDGYQSALGRIADRGAFTAWEFWPPSQDPHNMVLWFGVSMGVVGLALVTWVALEVGRSWWKQSKVTAAVPVAPLAVGVVLYAASVFAAPAAIQTLPLALLVLGASVRPEKRPASPRTSPSQQARIGAIALRSVAVALALLVGAYGLTRLSIADRLSAPEPTAAQRAADLWRVDAFLYYNASIRWGYAAQQTPEVHQKQLDLVAIRRAVSLEPANGLYQLESARTLVSYGMPQAEVEAAYRKAIELAPASPAALSSYAEYLISLGRKQEAKLLLDEAMRLARSTEAARVYAEYYRATGDEADALRYDALQREIAGALAQPGGAQP